MQAGSLVPNATYFYNDKPGSFQEVVYVGPLGSSVIFGNFRRVGSPKKMTVKLSDVHSAAERDAIVADFEAQRAAKAAAKAMKESTPTPRQIATEAWGNRIGEVRGASDVTFEDDTQGRQITLVLSQEDFEALAAAIGPFADGEKVPYKKLKPRPKAEAAASETPVADTPAQ